MSSGNCLTSKLYDKIIKMLPVSKSHETIPLNNLLSHYITNIGTGTAAVCHNHNSRQSFLLTRNPLPTSSPTQLTSHQPK
jgi:hypothetical protein